MQIRRVLLVISGQKDVTRDGDVLYTEKWYNLNLERKLNRGP
jgi:hypothetical protein